MCLKRYAKVCLLETLETIIMAIKPLIHKVIIIKSIKRIDYVFNKIKLQPIVCQIMDQFSA